MTHDLGLMKALQRAGAATAALNWCGSVAVQKGSVDTILQASQLGMSCCEGLVGSIA